MGKADSWWTKALVAYALLASFATGLVVFGECGSTAGIVSRTDGGRSLDVRGVRRGQ